MVVGFGRAMLQKNAAVAKVATLRPWNRSPVHSLFSVPSVVNRFSGFNRAPNLVMLCPSSGGAHVSQAQKVRRSRRGARPRRAVRSLQVRHPRADRKSTRLNSSHQIISYAVFCLKKKKQK